MQLQDKSNSKSTSQSDNSDSMSNTTKSQQPYINGPHSPLCQSKHLNMKTKNTSPESPESFVPETPQLLETQKTKPLNLMPVERNFKSLHKHNSPTSPGSSGTIDKSQKHQQPYNINTDVSSKERARNATQRQTLSLIPRNDKQLVTKLNPSASNNNNKSLDLSNYVVSHSNSSKRVNFDLSNSNNSVENETKLNSLVSQACSSNFVNSNSNKYAKQTLLKTSKQAMCMSYKNIVFNGTYPIDMPLKSRFNAILENYDPEANKSNIFDEEDEDGDGDDDDDDDYDPEDNDVEDDDEEYYEDNHAAWTIQELYNDPSIPLNYKKMCTDVETSLTNFEKFLDSKKVINEREVRTFDIDGPIIEEKKNI